MDSLQARIDCRASFLKLSVGNCCENYRRLGVLWILDFKLPSLEKSSFDLNWFNYSTVQGCSADRIY
jgi:hypothetical protein